MARLGTRQLGRGVDAGLATITVVLVVFGLAALYSFSLSGTEARYALLWRQALFALIGLIAAWMLIRIDYRWLAGVHWILYGLSILALILVLVLGQTVRGTTGWFVVGAFQIQPVEFVKILMAIFLAKFFTDRSAAVFRWRTVVESGFFVAVPVLLIMLQPDLGSALILLGIWLGLLFILPVPRRYLAALFGIFLLTAVFSWFAVLRPYQKDRILTFVFPSRDRLGSGYNVRQAITAVGAGQLFGRGLGLGSQSQLNFLPERQTDFMFASVSEELGFFGGGAIITLFGLFFWRIWRLTGVVRDNFSLLLSISLAMMFFVQVMINIGMNMGVFPVTGIPLPFLSYGGSSLISSLLAVGLLQSMIVRQRTVPL